MIVSFQIFIGSMSFRRIQPFLLVLICLHLALFSHGYNPPDSYLIDCGSQTNTTIGDRIFVADQFATGFLSTPANVLADTSQSVPSSDYSQLYQTARIFTGTTKYTFSINQSGRHWIRLYFNPFDFDGYSMSTANFSVTVPKYNLLNNFNVNTTIMKEFSINITSNALVISIVPSGSSFGFLNALEVVSMPDEIATNVPSILPSGNFLDIWWQALETVWRVNMGGPLVSVKNDTLWRTWVPDDTFLVNKSAANYFSSIGAVKYVQGMAPRNAAPEAVYGTVAQMSSTGTNSNFNLTWKFQVDVGFQYLVRFHFCDIVSKSLNLLYFNVYIDSSMVIQDLDLSVLSSNTLAAAYYYDLVTAMTQSNEMFVKVGPYPSSIGSPNAILNGLEIMKINNSLGDLGSGDTNRIPTNPGSKSNTGLIVGAIAGGSAAVVVFAGIIFVLCKRRRRRRLANEDLSKSWIPLSTDGATSRSTDSKYSNGTNASPSPVIGYRFPFAAVQEATSNFDESRIIGVGGFGKVYRGVLSDGAEVAVKRGSSRSQQGLTEFQTEIEMLSQFRHRHLVSLIGYCDDNNEMILVYEYMENGTLKSHLYGQGRPSLTWSQRLEICIGAARGLHYLHTSHAKPVIHRDVKSANILLDENLMAKVADFGLSKAGPEIDQTHVSTAVKGSFGYLDPEYFRRQQLTEKSDVYSFGVVLLEVLCARPVIDPTLPRDLVNLADWAMMWQGKGQLQQIIDPALVGKIRPNSLRKFGETAEKCLAEYGVDRPSMADVLWNLEYAFQLQEAVVPADRDENSMIMIGELSPELNSLSHVDRILAAAQFDVSSVDDVSTNQVFSQLVRSEGR